MAGSAPTGRSPAHVATWILVAAVAADLLLLAAHVASGLWAEGGSTHYWLTHYRLRLTNEESVGEAAQHLKTLLVVGLLVAAGRATGLRAWWAWATVFGWVLIDDALALHERGGSLLVEAFGSATLLGVGMQDVGELLVWTLIGAVLVPLFVGVLATDGIAGRRALGALAVPFLLFAAAGGGADVLHATAGDGSALRATFALVEEAGELLAMSLILARTVALTGAAAWRPAALIGEAHVRGPRHDPQGP